jgi:hypothetical protein
MMLERENYLTKIENGFKQTPAVLLISARQVGKIYSMNNFNQGFSVLKTD